MYYKYLRFIIGNKLLRFSIRYNDIEELLTIIKEIRDIHSLNDEYFNMFMTHLDENYYNIPNDLKWLEI